MKIKSKTDVITNSSDETYIIKTTKTAQEILDDLELHKNPEERCSGMGGILTVKTNDGFVGNDEDYYSYTTVPKGYAEITVDHGFTSISDYVKSLDLLTDKSEYDSYYLCEKLIYDLSSYRSYEKDNVDVNLIQENKEHIKEIIKILEGWLK